MVVDDPNEGVYRRGRVSKSNPERNPTSRDFTPRPQDEGMLSVDLRSLSTPNISVVDNSKFNLFELDIVDINNIQNEQGDNLIVETDALDNNAAHALIVRIEIDDDLTPLKLSEIADKATP